MLMEFGRLFHRRILNLQWWRRKRTKWLWQQSITVYRRKAIKITCQGAERIKTAKVQTLNTKFESMAMKDNETIDDYSMKLVGLVSNIRVLGEEIKKDMS